MANPWATVESFKDTQLDRLYRSPHSALGIFQKRISELAQSIVMTMLYVPRPIAKSDLELFVSPGSTRAYEQALSVLQQYRMVKTIQLGGVESFFLTHEFARSLKKALDDVKSNRGCSEAMEISTIEAMEMIDLDKYTAEQIHNIVDFVVAKAALSPSERTTSSVPPPTIVELLRKGGIISLPNSEGELDRTRLWGNGFQFLTEKLDTQLWTLILLYASNMCSKGFDEVDILSSVLLVASLKTGSAYSTIGLSKEQLCLLEFLSSVGVVLLHRRQNCPLISNYVPTRLATLLTSDIDSDLLDEENPLKEILTSGTHPSEGYIIIDAAFNVMAHPSAAIQTNLLSLFANLDSPQSKKISGIINQTSIFNALEQGISAQQIVLYTNAYAHPKMRAAARQQQLLTKGPRASALPSIIADQIYAWELEWTRAKSVTDSLVKQFESCLKCDLSCGCADQVKKTPIIHTTANTPKQAVVSVLGSA